jgi:pSer/pThr/pTyr-binding forkhead associated (FHA) protein
MPTCTHCGEPVSIDDRFCAHCGTSLVRSEGSLGDGIENTGSITSIIATGPATSGSLGRVGSGERADLEPGEAMLTVLRGPGEGTEFRISGDIVFIGRSPESEVFLDDVTVSRRHAEIRRGATGWSIRDAGSLNGTYVNRRRVEDQALVGGDELQIGKFRFGFFVGPARG